MVQASQLIAKVGTEGVDTAKNQLKDVGDTTKKVGDIMKNALGAGLSFAGGVAGQAMGFLKNQMVDSVKAAMENADVLAQTAQAIKSTGDASGMTTQSISSLADKLSKTTPFAKNLTEGGENLLLTFTGISKDVFPQTTQIMDDMAQAMHTGPTQEAMLLGKALNDPTTGLSALTRVGVTFSDQEKEQIKTMMSHNDVAGAQKVMLKELQTEFGGSAEAAGKTFGGSLEILKNRLTDVKEKIGTAVIPILSGMASFVSDKLMPVFDNFGNWFSSELPKVGAAFAPLLDPLQILWRNVTGMLVPAFDRLGGMFHQLFAGNTISGAGLFKDAIAGIGNIIGAVTSGIDDFYEGVVAIQQSPVVPMLRQFASTLSSELGPPLKNIAGLLSGQFKDALKFAGDEAKQVGGWFTSSVVPALKDALPGFLNLAKTILDTVVPAMIQIRGIIQDVIEHAFKVFLPIIEQVVPPLIRFAGVLANDIANGLKFIMPYVLQAAKAIGDFADGLMNRVAPIVKNVFGIISTIVQNFSVFWNAIWPAVSVVLKLVWDEITSIIKIAWSLVSGIINVGLDILSGNWSQAWTDIKTMFAGIWDGIKGVFSGAWDAIKAVWAPIGSWFTDRWTDIQNALSGVGSFFTSIGTDMWNGIKGGIDNIIGGINGLIGDLDSVQIHIPAIGIAPFQTPAFDWNGLGIPKIPLLASGGLIGGAGFAIVGEQGPEPVWLPQGAQVFPHSQLSQMQQSQPQASNQPIYLQIDGHTFARLFMPYQTTAIRNKVGVRF